MPSRIPQLQQPDFQTTELRQRRNQYPGYPGEPVIDPADKTLLPLRKLGKKLPAPRTYRTVLDWYRFGRKNRFTGKQVYLAVMHMPDGAYSTIAAYKQFIHELNVPE